jgi:hypothetical protein
MVGIKNRGNARGMPVRIFFAPDRLTKCQRGGQRSLFLKAEPIADNHPAVVISMAVSQGLAEVPVSSSNKTSSGV